MLLIDQDRTQTVWISSVTYPAIWRCEHISHGKCGVSCGRCGCKGGECACLKGMIHLQWETTASPNFGICDTTPFFSYLAGVHQCIREGQAVGMVGPNSNENLTHMSEGCRVHGHLEVNKVAGNFHIAPGQSFQQHHLHIHSLRNIRLNLLNTTHYINDLSFGEYFPNQINPLSDTKQITNDGAALFHYYVKIVPSTYVFLNKTELRTNQYSVTKHRKVIQNIIEGNSHQIPGTFFTYEISAIMVKFVERQRSLAQFLTSSCAIIV